MNDIQFNCPGCSQHLEAPNDMAGQQINCPICTCKLVVPLGRPLHKVKVETPAHNTTSAFPIIIKASPRALYATYIHDAIIFLFIFFVLMVTTLIIGSIHESQVIIVFLWAVSIIAMVFKGASLWLKYLRLSNTKYLIYPNKIEASSYTFQFMGVHNNVANLKQLRQIHAAVNSYLDLWFFHCGHVSLTVSGDVEDFVLEDVYKPGQIRRQIEEIVFGKDSVQRGDATPEVGD